MYLAHQNGRVIREKIRVRTYVSSGLTFLEVKNKNNKGRTDKKRIRVQGVNSLRQDGELHVRPSGISKYCVGTVLTAGNLKYNRFKPKLRMAQKIAKKQLMNI